MTRSSLEDVILDSDSAIDRSMSALELLLIRSRCARRRACIEKGEEDIESEFSITMGDGE